MSSELFNITFCMLSILIFLNGFHILMLLLVDKLYTMIDKVINEKCK
jgi:hypothetical protein